MMFRFLKRLSGALAACACLATAPLAQTRDLTVDDVVALEGFGRASISPDGRWAVYEKRGAYDTIPRFDYAQRSIWAITDLWRVDLAAEAPRPERLLPDEPLGLLRGDWSPDGASLAVFRMRDGAYELGVATPASRSVRWTGLTPEYLPKGAPVSWLSPDRLIAVIRPDGSLPPLLAFHNTAQERISEAWRRKSEGRAPTRTVVDTAGGVQTPETPPTPQRLVEIDVASGRIVRTLAEGAVTDQVVSPDGRMVAVLSGAEPLPLGDPVVQFDEPLRQRLTLIRLEDGRRTGPEARVDVAAQMLRWSPDSREVLFWGRRDDQRWSEGSLQSMDLDGGIRRWPSELDLGGDHNILRGVRADWLDGVPVIHGRANGASRPDWHRLDGVGQRSLTAALAAPPARIAATPGDGTLRLFADGGYWRLDAEGVHRLTPEGLRLQPVFTADSERPTRIVLDAPRARSVAAVAEDGQAVLVGDEGVQPLGGRGEPGAAQVMASSAQALLVLERKELVETLRLRRGEQDLALDVVNADRADVELIRPEWLEHPDALGEPGRSTLFLPKGPVRGLVVHVYPGYVDGGEWFGPLVLTYNIRAAVLAGAGYAVLHPAMAYDRPGTRSPEFFVDSIDRAVDAAFAAHPELPRDRTAIFGHSMGGYIGLVTATRSDRYQSYILSSAATDMFAHWGELTAPTRIQPENGMSLRLQQGWVETGQGEVGATPWGNPEALMKESPWLKADQIEAPILLLTADMDYVALGNSERVFSALARLGGRARLVTYWGEHHARWSPANIRDQYGQVFRWLEETLPAASELRTAAGDAPRIEPSPQRPPPSGSPHSDPAR